jgi:AP-1-like factor
VTVDTCGQVTRLNSRRAAQRAFRERKQEQLAELQERVRRYEQGEVERHVALQAAARRLKEENDTLRQENEALKLQVEQLVGDVAKASEKRAPSPALEATVDVPPYKRRRSTISFQARRVLDIASLISGPLPSPPSPPLTMSSWDAHSITMAPPGSPSPSASTSAFAHIDEPMIMQPVAIAPVSCMTGPIGCGLCEDGNPCLCAQIVRGEDATMLDLTTTSIPDPGAATSLAEPSILDDLPPYQAAVSLKRRTNPIKRNTIFAVTSQLDASTLPQSEVALPMCTGDPSNCGACADDAFGKAFCTAVGQSMMVVTSEPCANCPRMAPSSSGSTSSGCCKDMCKACPEQSSESDYGVADRITAPIPRLAPHTSGNIPCNEAWQQIKAHPNAKFADLQLLADVVARRSKCTGPRVVLSPDPGSVPTQSNSPSATTSEPSRPTADMPDNDHLTAHPLEAQIRCGKPSIRELPAEAVRDAMRLLEVMAPHKA